MRKITLGPNCFVIITNNHEFFFSYETCVGYRGIHGKARLENTWGNITEKYINKLGIKDFPIISVKEFKELINKI